MDFKQRTIIRWIIGAIEFTCIVVGIILLYLWINIPRINTRPWFILDAVVFVLAMLVLFILENFVFKSDEDELRDVYGNGPIAAG